MNLRTVFALASSMPLVPLLLSAQLASAGSENTLSVDAAVSEAMRNSPSIQQSEAALGENSWKDVEAFGDGFMPKVTVGFNHFFAEKYEETTINFGGTFLDLPGAYSTNELVVNASIPVFNGFASYNRLRAATLTKNASEQEHERNKFVLAQDVRLAFYQALAAAELQNVAQQNVKTLEDHLKEVDIQRSGGSATKYDTLRVSVQLSEARADAIDAGDNVNLSRKKLTALLGLEEDSRPLIGALPVPDISRVKDLELAGTPTDRSDIEALELRSQAAEHLHSAQQMWIVPSVSLGGQFNYYDEMIESTIDGSVNSSGDYKPAYNVGVFFTWNLFDGGVSYAKSREADYQKVQVDRQAEQARIQVPYDFTFWKKRFLANTDHYQARKYDVDRSTESVRLAQEEERAGTRTSTETLDAELDLFRSKAGVVNAQLNALEARIRLELALGRTL